jgi:hypothetical protein
MHDIINNSQCENLKYYIKTFCISVALSATHMMQQTISFGPKLQQYLYDGTIFSVLSALDNISKDSAKTKENSLRAHAIEEILTSEVNYLHQLEVIMQVILDSV